MFAGQQGGRCTGLILLGINVPKSTGEGGGIVFYPASNITYTYEASHLLNAESDYNVIRREVSNPNERRSNILLFPPSDELVVYPLNMRSSWYG